MPPAHQPNGTSDRDATRVIDDDEADRVEHGESEGLLANDESDEGVQDVVEVPASAVNGSDIEKENETGTDVDDDDVHTPTPYCGTGI